MIRVLQLPTQLYYGRHRVHLVLNKALPYLEKYLFDIKTGRICTFKQSSSTLKDLLERYLTLPDSSQRTLIYLYLLEEIYSQNTPYFISEAILAQNDPNLYKLAEWAGSVDRSQSINEAMRRLSLTLSY